jgi:hypothetical protein
MLRTNFFYSVKFLEKNCKLHSDFVENRIYLADANQNEVHVTTFGAEHENEISSKCILLFQR